jgi:hypothetical protein
MNTRKIAMGTFRFSDQAMADIDLLTAALQRAVPVGHVSKAQALEWAVSRGLAELVERECQQADEAIAATENPAEPLPTPEHPANMDRSRLTEQQQDAQTCAGSLHRALEVKRYLVPPRTAPLPFPRMTQQPRLL